MQIRIDASEFDKLVQEMMQKSGGAKAIVKQAVMAQSLDTIKEVKEKMPIDTGRARASWGAFTPEDIEKPNTPNGKMASKSDTFWHVEDGGLTITQGSNVEYVGDLNDGTSSQRGAGFIDRAAEKAGRELMDRVGRDFERFLSTPGYSINHDFGAVQTDFFTDAGWIG